MSRGYGDLLRRREILAFAVFLASLGRGTAAALPRLLTFGDSLTAGYGLPARLGFEAQIAAALAHHGHPVHLIDGGVSGDTSADGLARLDWVLAEAPDAAIVELGANDGLRGLPPALMERNLAAILDAFARRRIPVLFCGMFAPPNLGPDYERRFRAAFARLGRRRGVIYYPFFLAGVALHPQLLQADGLHPNARGVTVIVHRLFPDVLKLLSEMRRP